MSLEEISVYELDRVGAGLDNDINLLYETLSQDPAGDKSPLMVYINSYLSLIKKHNKLVKESNLYLEDHIVKYYRDEDTKELSYKATKKKSIGYI